jgi:hypothetical protein
MSSTATFVLQSGLLFVPWMIAALGGYVSFRHRNSRVLVRSVQLTTAVALFAFGLGFWWANYAFAVWFVPAISGLVISFQLAASSPFVDALASRTLLNLQSVTAPRRWGVLLMGLSPLFLAGGLWQIEVMAAPPIESMDGLKDYPTADLVEVTDISAYTDHGRRVPLHKVRAETLDSVAIEGDQGLPKEGTPLPYRAIRLMDPDTVSNCVGWVFTGAHSWILCRNVQPILEDNGYQAVTDARPGDLVIYRDSNNEIVHAGAVVALTDNGQPLIESKWGYQGVFLHLPEGTPYGDTWTYYRSPRHSHLLLSSPLGDPGVRATGETSP